MVNDSCFSGTEINTQNAFEIFFLFFLCWIEKNDCHET